MLILLLFSHRLGIERVNADGVRPDKPELYEIGFEQKLSQKGLKAYWHSMNDVIRRIDQNKFLTLKELIRRCETGNLQNKISLSII